MPKTKKKVSSTKILTRTLYTYVKPINDYFARRVYKKRGFDSYSAYVDSLIERDRRATLRANRSKAA
jgi:hypothetical protein